MEKKKIAQIIITTILLLIPGIYTTIFLCAYHDPMSNLSNIPVAVVNQDQGGKVGGKSTNIGKTLVDNLKSTKTVNLIFTKKSKADYGVIHQKYYAEIIIPKDFTQNISTVSTKDKKKGIIYFKSNDKLGMMGSSIMSTIASNVENNISKNISKSIINNMAQGIKAMPAGMQKLSEVLGKLDYGTKQLEQGLQKMYDGQTKFNMGISNLSNGLGKAEQGAAKLSSGTKTIYEKSNQFANGINISVTGAETLSGYSEKYKAGFSTVTLGLDNYINNSTIQLQNSIKMMTLLKKYVSAHMECMADPNIKAILAAINLSKGSNQGKINIASLSGKLTTALNKLNNSYGMLDNNIQKLPDKMSQASKGTAMLSSALGKISNGSSGLSLGISKAANGAKMLNEKSNILLSGDQRVYNGVKNLNSAIKRIKSSVDESVTKSKANNNTFSGLGSFISQPINMKITKIGEAENVGTAFAPFMISLCLYLGGIIIMATLLGNKDLKFQESKLTGKLHVDFRIFLYPLISVGQSLIVAFCANSIVGINVQNVPQFYGICALAGLALSIFVETLNILFKGLGQVLSLILMVCQLTAGGGVMPVKILPSFYRAIHPYMPMTYTLTALRNVIQGFESESYLNSIEVLTGIILVCAFIIILHSYITHIRKSSEVKEIEQLSA